MTIAQKFFSSTNLLRRGPGLGNHFLLQILGNILVEKTSDYLDLDKETYYRHFFLKQNT